MSSAPTASPLDLSTDIAIVGAGPVGLMIANYLGQDRKSTRLNSSH